LCGLRREIVHAFRKTRWPMSGPVHLNCPFRDPLPPLTDAKPHALRAGELAGFFRDVTEASAAVLHRVPAAARPRASGDGIIVVGPNDPVSPRAFMSAVDKMSRALGWPVLADALSPLRMHAEISGHLVTHYDTILRSPRLADELRPKRVICVGGWPTSKVLREWLKQANPAVLLVTDRSDDMDGLHLRTRHVRGDIVGWCEGFSGQGGTAAHTRCWLAADRLAAAKLTEALAAAKAFIEPLVVPALSRALPKEATVFVASSMPVRDLEYFWPAGRGRQRIQFNRGANGIDGTLSTALGVAHGARRPAVLLTGDLALLHDTNGFLSVPRFRGSLTIVLINNHGGGIFEHLPVAQFNPPFEEFFATPQRVDFAKLCAAYGVGHTVVTSVAQLDRLLTKLPQRGVRVLEVCTDRKRDAAWRKAAFARVASAL
jgi:2-succinyl-5-enolpyruvyl-6-hydroxy-3-cyclohexene-1-carboxylate synthase